MTCSDLHSASRPVAQPEPVSTVASLASGLTILCNRLVLAQDAEAEAWNALALSKSLQQEAVDLADSFWADLDARAETLLAQAGRSREPGAREAGLAILLFLMGLAAPPIDAALMRARMALLGPLLKSDGDNLTAGKATLRELARGIRMGPAILPQAQRQAPLDEPLRCLLRHLAQDLCRPAPDGTLDASPTSFDRTAPSATTSVGSSASLAPEHAEDLESGFGDDWLDWEVGTAA